MLTQILTLTQTKQRDMNPYPVFVLLLSFGTNILAKFFVNFVLHEGKRTETGYSFMSRFLVRVRARIRVSVHKQRHMGRHVEQKLSSMPSSSYFVVLLKLSRYMVLLLSVFLHFVVTI